MNDKYSKQKKIHGNNKRYLASSFIEKKLATTGIFMAESKHRLDRFLSIKTKIPKKNIRLLLAQKRVTVDGVIAYNTNEIVDQFSLITLDEKIIQERKPRYLMMHKPMGVVSATKDDQHKTVIDILRENNTLDITDKEISELHIVGRLDLNSSGLLLLTNNSQWSKKLMSPEHKVEKTYEVELANPITQECIDAFAEGMYFPYENITTKPARLEKISEHSARVYLIEGKYHQIKRMFGRFRNPVLKLHRIKVGQYNLDSSLKEGEIRELSEMKNE